jgi:NADPH2:quinone reductase
LPYPTSEVRVLAIRIDAHGGPEVLAVVELAEPVPGPGESALVHAAAGGTGSLLVQFLIQQGVTVLASTSSEEKAEYLRSIGVEHVIDHRQSELVAFGQSSGPVPPMDIARLSGLTDEGLPGSVWLTWPTLADYNSTRDALVRRAAAVFGAVLDGTISPAIAGSLPLRRAARAHELLEARATTGKLLLEP